MAGFTFEQTGSAGVLSLEGALTVQQAKELKDALLSALSRAERVSLRLEQVTEVDIAGLQVLCSAYRTAVNKNKSLLLAGPVPDGFAKVVADSGYSCRSGCLVNSKTRCPWI
jgi:anti-anti-sigma factor